VWAILSQELCSRLENYGRSRQRRRPYFVNSRLITDGFKDKTTAINSATATQNNLPSDFILAYAPASEGPEFAGEGAEIQQQSQAERRPRGPGPALESSFWSVALGTAPGGR
jgi:hypothetical protein